jgi:VWFA-related protein
MPGRTQTPAAEGTIKSSAQNVLVDVVVRDKKGRAVTDLKPSEFQITDNGETVPVQSFRLVHGSEAVEGQGGRQTLDPLRQVRLVTLIFDRLDMNARRLAREAALELIKTELPQNVYVAVMTIDQRLQAIQQFTNDRDLLKRGIDRATNSDVSDFSGDSATVRSQLATLVGAPQGAQSVKEQVDQMPTGATAASGPGAAPNGSQMVAQLTATIMMRILDSDQRMASGEAGRASIFSLLAAVKEQYRLPGRKTVLYFSGGFRVPQGMEEAFRSVISIANRSNVSFYCIDAGGLGIDSQNSGARGELAGAAQASRESLRRGGAVSQEQVKAQDRALESNSANMQNILDTLAVSTGGALIANTNDFKAPIRRVNEDIQTYYELSYSPKIDRYDGSFHKLGVKLLARSDLKVQSRSGYFALPPGDSSSPTAVSSYEVPLLQALEAAAVPHTFDFQAAGQHYRGTGAQAIGEVVIDVPLSNLTLQENKAAGVSEGRLAYLLLVKNAQNEVVKRFSKEIPLKVPAAKLAALKESHFIYTDTFEADPGTYTLDAAISDSQGNRISTQKTTFNLLPNTPALGISSISAIRSIKEKAADTSAADPFLMVDKVVTPTLNPVIKKAAVKELPMYLVIYPKPGSAAATQLVMEFSKDGQVLGNGRPALSAPDAAGRIQYVATAPIDRLAPGSYKIRFLVSQGADKAEEAIQFVVQ